MHRAIAKNHWLRPDKYFYSFRQNTCIPKNERKTYPEWYHTKGVSNTIHQNLQDNGATT